MHGRHVINEPLHLRPGLQGIQQPIGDGIIPIHGDGDQRRVYVLPAFNGQHHRQGGLTAVEHLDVIKLRGIFNVNFRMAADLGTNGVYRRGISLLDHHQRLPVEILNGQTGAGGQGMLPGHGNTVLVAAQGKKLTVIQPQCRIANAHQQVKFCAQGGDFRQNALVIVLK